MKDGTEVVLVIGIVQAAALVWTLIWVRKYTKETKRMADSMAGELGLKKRPVVSVVLRRSDDRREDDSFRRDRGFHTTVTNFSNVPARVRIEATTVRGDKSVKLPNENLYSGTKIWDLQAKYRFNGEINLEPELRRLGCTPSYWEEAKTDDGRWDGMWLLINSWAGNYYDRDCELTNDSDRNPPVAYMWKGKQWVAQIPPEDVVAAGARRE